MAETTGKDMPATDPKSAVGKTGPVRPPVLEGTARPSATGKPADVATAARTDPKTDARPTDKPGATSAAGTARPVSGSPAGSRTATPPPEGSGGSGAWLAGIVGGAIGLGAAYGLAWFGLWPTPAAVPPAADPRLAQFATTIPELETVAGTMQDELTTLTSRVGALEAADASDTAAAPAAADPALAEQLQALSARLDDVAAAAGNGEGADVAAALEAELTALQADMANANAQLAQSQQQLTALTQSADDTAGANAATIRLPLVFSGLEAAFVSGRAYETELAALRQALPETIVPEPVAARAAAGLPRPDAVAAELSAALPAMLAGRPADADADWQDATLDWFRGLVAMRPAGDVQGDGPDAIVARLEAAVERRDFLAAQAELAALPAPMQAAAGEVAADVDSLAAAQDFLARLRAQALNGESGT